MARRPRRRATPWRSGKFIGSGLAALALVLAVPPSASAAGSAYASWTIAGANPSWTGTLTGAATGFPAGGIATNSNTPAIVSGASTFLGPATPFGAAFGSSQAQPYLNVRTAASNQPSTTTITFSVPTPSSGWGFALGDVDSEQVQITATGPTGQPVPVSSLGFQGSFNYCAVSPKPPSCTNAPFTDLPTWNPVTATLAGHGPDTDGAAGWFRPTSPIGSLTLISSRLQGFPIYQLWVAAATATISGQVLDTPTNGPPTPSDDTTLKLLHTDGTSVLDASNQPASATTGADGTFTFPSVVEAIYDVEEVPPPGQQALGPGELLVDASHGDVSNVDLTLEPASAPSPSAPSPPTAVTAKPAFTG